VEASPAGDPSWAAAAAASPADQLHQLAAARSIHQQLPPRLSVLALCTTSLQEHRDAQQHIICPCLLAGTLLLAGTMHASRKHNMLGSQQLATLMCHVIWATGHTGLLLP
jgi:hypothetical protein